MSKPMCPLTCDGCAEICGELSRLRPKRASASAKGFGATSNGAASELRFCADALHQGADGVPVGGAGDEALPGFQAEDVVGALARPYLVHIADVEQHRAADAHEGLGGDSLLQ